MHFLKKLKMAYRLDKFVWCVRLTKTRSLASEAVSKGKVKLNNQQVKPSREPKVGDVIYVSKNTAVFSYEIIELLDKRVGAKLVENYIKDITPLTELEKYKLYSISQATYRQNGSGKPSKKDRRDINEFFDF
jgi:ribosome-associated heat shock protein Hsp15